MDTGRILRMNNYLYLFIFLLLQDGYKVEKVKIAKKSFKKEALLKEQKKLKHLKIRLQG